MKIIVAAQVFISLAFFALACGKPATTGPTPKSAAPLPTSAYARIAPLGESGVSGNLMFNIEGEGVRIEGTIINLRPNGQLGFHIHEKGDCSAFDGSSAGGHFNPAHADHGTLNATVSHKGDLGNLAATPDGVGIVNILKDHVSLDDGPNSYVGRAVIIHAAADDLVSQPSGNAGARIACGVILRTR